MADKDDRPSGSDLPPSHRPFADNARVTISFGVKPLRLPTEIDVPEGDEEVVVHSRFPHGLPAPVETASAAPVSASPDGEVEVLRISTEPPTEPNANAGAFDLVDRSVPPPPISPDVEMTERFALGDFSGALRVAELVLGRDATHLQARSIADASRAELVHIYSSRLGGMQVCPRLIVDRATLGWLGVDARAQALIAHLDGKTSLDQVLEHANMPVLDALKILAELVDARAVRAS